MKESSARFPSSQACRCALKIVPPMSTVSPTPSARGASMIAAEYSPDANSACASTLGM